jgi:hypothetical protein
MESNTPPNTGDSSTHAQVQSAPLAALAYFPLAFVITVLQKGDDDFHAKHAKMGAALTAALLVILMMSIFLWVWLSVLLLSAWLGLSVYGAIKAYAGENYHISGVSKLADSIPVDKLDDLAHKAGISAVTTSPKPLAQNTPVQAAATAIQTPETAQTETAPQTNSQQEVNTQNAEEHNTEATSPAAVTSDMPKTESEAPAQTADAVAAAQAPKHGAPATPPPVKEGSAVTIKNENTPTAQTEAVESTDLNPAAPAPNPLQTNGPATSPSEKPAEAQDIQAVKVETPSPAAPVTPAANAATPKPITPEAPEPSQAATDQSPAQANSSSDGITITPAVEDKTAETKAVDSAQQQQPLNSNNNTNPNQ